MEGRAIFLARLLQGKVPGVLDADGLTLAAEKDLLPPAVPWVLTPHPGEMARLVGGSPAALMDDPLPACGELAASSGCVVVFKCHVVFIFAPDGRFRVVDGMNAALGTGGSGDVLGGLIADSFPPGWTPSRRLGGERPSTRRRDDGSGGRPAGFWRRISCPGYPSWPER